MRRACEWIWSLIGGAALHTLTMLLGFLFLLLIGGKGPESIFHLVFGIWIPFFISGAILADRKTRFLASIAILSSLLAVAVPPLAIAWYWDWNGFKIGNNYFWTLTGVPVSLLGAYYMRRRQRLAQPQQQVPME